jgi:type IV pilus assembly protein PilB
VLGPEQLEEARGMAAQTGAKLQDALIKLNYATPQEVMSAVAEHHNMQFVDLKGLAIPTSVVEMVPESVARENQIIPLSHENNALQIVMSDPNDLDTIEKLRFILNKDIQPVLSDREDIIAAINNHYGQSETESVDSMLSEFTDTQIDFTETEATGSISSGDESDSPVIKLVNLIIQEAIKARASDIHIEPFSDRVRVRYRIDGVLVERDSPPRRLLAPLTSRIKIMGKAAAARRAHQDVGARSAL